MHKIIEKKDDDTRACLFRVLCKGLRLDNWQLFDSVLGDDLEAENWEVD